MDWKFTDDAPIYQQIMNIMKRQIASGELKAGQKLSSVRELALEAGVNPNTMQRAFACLEDEGLVITAGTLGRFVTDDDRVIAEARERIASFLVADFARKITGLGYTLHDGAQMVENFNISKEDNTDGNSGS